MNSIRSAMMSLAMVLWGIGLSLPDKQLIGIAGVGVGECLLLGASLITAQSRTGRAAFVTFFARRPGFLLAAVCFIGSFAVGTLWGALRFGEPVRSAFIFLRATFYLFLLVPTVAIWAANDAPRLGLWSFVTGALLSSAANVWAYQTSSRLDLPGQNELGIQVSMILPVFLYFGLSGATFVRRLTASAVAVVVCGIAFMTWSKAAWIVCLLQVVLVPMAMLAHSAPRMRGRLFFGVAVALCLALALGLFLSEDITRIYQVELSASEGSDSNEQRLLATMAALDVAAAYPFGVGGPHYQVATAELRADLLWAIPDPHNSYALVVSWAGVLGLLPFLIVFFAPLARVLSRRHLRPGQRPLYLAMFVAIYLHAAANGTLVTQPSAWALFGLVFGALDDSSTTRQESWRTA